MQPVISGLIIAGNDPIKVNDPEQRTESPLANGQFILIRRTVYEAIEGHAAVRQNVLDDVGLATAVTAAQFDYHLLFLTDLFSVRMYDSLGALWQGWTKNLFPGMGRNWSALFGLVAFQFCFVMLPLLTIIAALVGLVSTAWLVWALPGYVFLHLLRTYLDHIFGQRLWFGFTHELGSLMLAILLLVSAYQTTRGKAVWKGRVVE